MQDVMDRSYNGWAWTIIDETNEEDEENLHFNRMNFILIWFLVIFILF
jgi:hypothetical protein